MTRYFFYAFLTAAAANFVCSVQVLRELSAAGVRIGYFEMRWQVHKHLKTYRQISIDKEGRTAPLYYAYWVTLAGMVLFGLLTLLTLKH